MKSLSKCEVELPQGSKDVFFLIDSTSAFEDYSDVLEKETNDVVERVMNKPVKEWEYHQENSQGGFLFSMAVTIAKLKGTPPLEELDDIIKTKLLSIGSLLLNNEMVIVNMLGSYHVVTDEHKILSRCRVVKETPNYHNIKNNTTYLNLENSDTLDPHTNKFLSKIDNNYSYVLSLREYKEKELDSVIGSFIRNGGSALYIYNTGLDVVQLEKCMTLAMNSGIVKVIFEFSSGYNEMTEIVLNNFSDVMDVEIIH